MRYLCKKLKIKPVEKHPEFENVSWGKKLEIFYVYFV